jgi:GrpB-like predicted nucleotidyltransferase (UPF0157 family)
MGEPPIRPYPYPSPPPALRPWNPGAPAAADHVVSQIVDRLPGTTVEHVGSSAVPDCAGKGYLDFAIPYRDDMHLAAINEALFALGFGRQRNRDPFPETRPMRTGAFDYEGEPFLLHVHVVPDNSPDMAELLDFRDRLRADPTLVADYVAAKHKILRAGVLDGVDYAERKGKFIAALGYYGVDDA